MHFIIKQRNMIHLSIPGNFLQPNASKVLNRYMKPLFKKDIWSFNKQNAFCLWKLDYIIENVTIRIAIIALYCIWKHKVNFQGKICKEFDKTMNNGYNVITFNCHADIAFYYRKISIKHFYSQAIILFQISLFMPLSISKYENIMMISWQS